MNPFFPNYIFINECVVHDNTTSRLHAKTADKTWANIMEINSHVYLMLSHLHEPNPIIFLILTIWLNYLNNKPVYARVPTRKKNYMKKIWTTNKCKYLLNSSVACCANLLLAYLNLVRVVALFNVQKITLNSNVLYLTIFTNENKKLLPQPRMIALGRLRLASLQCVHFELFPRIIIFLLDRSPMRCRRKRGLNGCPDGCIASLVQGERR